MRRSLLALLIALVGLGALYTVSVGANAPGSADQVPNAVIEEGALPDPLEPLTSTVVLALQPASAAVGIGDIFTTAITVIAGSQQVDGVAAYIDFNPAAFQVVDPAGNPQEFIDNPGTPLNTELMNFVDNTAGKIDYAVGKLSGSKPSGTFVAGTVRFKALAPGSGVSFVFDSGNNRKTDVTYLGGTVLSDTIGGVFTVLQTPSSVSIAGPSAGALGASLTFTATTLPVTTSLPITYTWEATGLSPVTHSGGLTDTVDLTWPSAGPKTITVTATNPTGAVVNNTASVVLYTPGVADFAGAPLSGVAPLVVTFTNQSTGDVLSNLWVFGDGYTSTETSPAHIYAAKGVYTVSLTVTDPGGSNTLTRGSYIEAYAPAVASFSGTPLSGIVPFTVTFTNESSGDWSSALWNFGDGITSTETAGTVQHSYATGGVYSVSLTVSGNGGTDTETQAGYVVAYTPVQADFSATPITGGMPLTVTFSNLSAGSFITATWNFGDGGTSVAISPTHMYAEPGVYTVSLSVGGPGGVSSLTKANYITVTTSVDLALLPGSANVVVNQIFTTAITVIAGAQQINGVGAYLDFDPAKLQVVDAAGNPSTVIENAAGNPLTTELANFVDNDAGTVDYAVGKLSGALPSGTFQIGIIRFKAITTTTSTAVDFVFDSGNNRKTEVTYGPAKSALRDVYGAAFRIDLLPVPPSTVTVTGPTSGVAGVPYDFAASVLPVTASQPITYTWQADGQTTVVRTGGTLSDANTYTWSTGGAKAITVTATNAYGSATDSMSIVVANRVVDVDLVPDLALKHGDPGADISYLVNVINSGNYTDVFTVTVTSGAWSALPAGPVTVSLGAGASANVPVTVSIPSNADGEATSATVVTATSGYSPAVSGGVTLVTRANRTYGWSIAAPVVTGSANPGAAASFALTVTNQGNYTNSWTVNLSGNTWSAQAVPTTIGPIARDAQASGSVLVTVPANAAAFVTDTVVVTLTSTGNDGVSAPITLTTAANEVVAVVVSTTNSVGAAPTPGDVTYTVSVRNSGNITTTNTVNAPAGNSWPTVVAPTNLGSLAPNAVTSMVVTVTIPATATQGSSDSAGISVVADDGGGLSVTGTLTLTTFYGIEHGIDAVPSSTVTGPKDTQVVHSIRITNTGNIADVYTITVPITGNNWAIQYPSTVSVNAGASVDVPITVTVGHGQLGNPSSLVDVKKIRFTSQGDPPGGLFPAVYTEVDLITNQTVFAATLSPVGKNTDSVDLSGVSPPLGPSFSW